MHELAAWCGFLGAWLLVAGPVYQAVLELRAEELETDRLRAAMSEIEEPPRVSPWWWLVPPVRLVLQRRRTERHQQHMMDTLSDPDYEAFRSYVNKAFGWLLVGLGGLFIAAKETVELAELHEWPTWLPWLLVVVMLWLSFGNAGARNRHDRQVTQRRAAKRQREV